MSNRTMVSASVAACLLAVASLASAQTVTSLVGDKDGLGIGVTNGQGFDYTQVGPADVQGTDTWVYGDQSVVHDYALPASFTSATLELFTGGQGLNGLSSVYLNGTFIGNLTDGDNVGPSYNYGWKDTFDLSSYLGLLTGHDTVTIRTFAGASDGWALDYSELKLVGAVPEPSTYALMALGLAGVAFVSRRRKAEQR